MSLLQLQVKTLDGEITLEVKKTIRGQNLFNMVCTNIGIIETWYFGILLENKDGFSWLRNNKRLHKQIKNTQTLKPLWFLVKFHPICLKDVQMMSSKYLFYLQLKKSIISESIYCPADVAVLLASYSLKIQHGNLNFDYELINVTDLIPNSALSLYNTNLNMWGNLLMVWFKKLEGLSREEAVTEYLDICNDLAMYGLNYFSVKSENGINLWLGCATSGIKLYNEHDFLKPNISYDWHEIRKVCVDCKTLTVKFTNIKKNLKLYVEKKLLDELFHLLVENHEFFFKRHEFKISELKIQGDNEPGVNVIESLSDRCKELKEVINLYQSKFIEMKRSYKQMEQLNMLMSEKCNLAEEEAIILCSMISAQCLKQSRQIVSEFQQQSGLKLS